MLSDQNLCIGMPLNHQNRDHWVSCVQEELNEPETPWRPAEDPSETPKHYPLTERLERRTCGQHN